MLRPRIIPCLLIKNRGLVKTQNFCNPRYIGDPINAVRILNEKEVDELIVADIDATVEGRGPDYIMIGNLAAECRMPLCYSGGVSTVEQIERIVSLGVEKVALSWGAIASSGRLISDAASRVGTQSVVAVMDVRKTGVFKRYEVWTHNATKRTGINAVEFAQKMEGYGAGEIVVNSIDRDGVMNGYDFELISQVRAASGLPLTALGGAGSMADIEELVRRFRVIGAAAGSLFVFKGKYRAVLINYPERKEKDALLAKVGL